MAARTFSEYWSEGNGEIGQRTEHSRTWKAAIKSLEARPTVRAKRPVQQRKPKTTCNYGGECRHRTVKGICKEIKGQCSEQITSGIA